ncbi:hypothetical protein [Pararhodospirillum photometricum]|uniref:hypothetical protein n=1 Tax=Pararhodospirillum photometricum TaxID=1084 RepID=UPI0002DAAFD7|nr:hypothetical protein [Pararhodospirillum photometricum]
MHSTLVFPDPGSWDVLELPFTPDRILCVEVWCPDKEVWVTVAPERWRCDGARILPVGEWPTAVEMRVTVAS